MLNTLFCHYQHFQGLNRLNLWRTYRPDDLQPVDRSKPLPGTPHKDSVRHYVSVAQNYMASEKSRMLEAYHTTLKMTAVFGVLFNSTIRILRQRSLSWIVPQRGFHEAGGIFLRIDGYSMLFMMLKSPCRDCSMGQDANRSSGYHQYHISTHCAYRWLLLLSAKGLGIIGVWWAISISSMLKGVAAYLVQDITEEDIITKVSSFLLGSCNFYLYQTRKDQSFSNNADHIEEEFASHFSTSSTVPVLIS